MQVLWSGGLVMDPVVRSTDHRSLITVTTPAQIMFDRRVRLLDLAAELGNVSAACRHPVFLHIYIGNP